MLKNRFWQSAVLAAAVAGSSMVMAADTIKVGVLALSFWHYGN